MALLPNRSKPDADKAAEREAAQNDSFLREVDEAVRQDEMLYAARRYGIPALVVAGIGLAAFGGFLLWKEQRESGLEEHSEQLVRGIDHLAAGDLDTALSSVDPVIADGADGAQASARLMRAGVLLARGEKAEAISLYGKVADDSSAPQPYRDAAAVRLVAADFDGMKPADIERRLKPLAVPGKPWFGSAGEMLAMSYLAQGKKEQAGTLFAAIAKDKEVPETLRSRTRQMAGILGVDAIVDADTFVKSAEEGETAPAQ